MRQAFPLYIDPGQSAAKLLGPIQLLGEYVFVTLTRCLRCGAVILENEDRPIEMLRHCIPCLPYTPLVP